MTNQEAIKEILRMSSGTIAALKDLDTYDQVDAWVAQAVAKVEKADVSKCGNWADVLTAIGELRRDNQCQMHVS